MRWREGIEMAEAWKKQVLQRKVVMVTGAGSGIGRACALAFAKDGAAVVLVDRDEAPGVQSAHMVETVGGLAAFFRVDVSRVDPVRQMVEEVIRRFGRIDVAVNNAGIEGPRANTVECSPEDWDSVLGVNLRGMWLCMKYQIPQMIKQGGGAIVNCSSVAGKVGLPESPAYSASKHGVIGLTQTAALEFARANIRINAVCPGAIQTPMLDRYVRNDENIRRQLIASEPMGRFGNPSEVAEAVYWLASERASFITGISLPVDGGWLS
jgi:NAD(P)-dependent dehydrogenase (short-subunit alcohol dehydrogenase family)